MTKRIRIDQLRTGMYVVGIDKSWWQTPFLYHKWTPCSPVDVVRLKEAGVREVIIDLQQGEDVEEPTSPSETLLPMVSAHDEVVRTPEPAASTPSLPPTAAGST